MSRLHWGMFAGVLILIAAPLISGAAPPTAPVRQVSITNGPRSTTSGAPIDAHSGTILRASDGFFYWYGETYACGFYWTDPSTPYCGAQVYRSNDMVDWEGPWPLFDATSAAWQNLCMHQPSTPGNGCFRPKVVFNKSTRLYVLWLNTPNFTADGYRVLTSPNPTGPFTPAAKPELHDEGIPDWRGNPHAADGDEALFVDGKGIAWLVWSRGGRLLQERLNSGYTTGAGAPAVIMNYPQLAPWGGVESPSEFAHDGRYYIAMSLPRCPYCAGTGTAIEQATAPGGPWTYQGTVSPDSCGGQPNEVDQLAPGVLLWSSDRWLQGGAAGNWPRLNETKATQQWEVITFDEMDVAPIVCASSFNLVFRGGGV
ncbi:MAG: hypothetical protein E6I55_07935 [Chloroflexi bacterium]|nr:MAG: hypothetical protein E6I55_07935 [Chloroflexota bacterium]